MGDFYETDRALGEYLLFHYGDPSQLMPWPLGPVSALDFPARCVSECLDLNRLPPDACALDLGCAVGRSSFELARHCTRVIGMDSSGAFIRAATELARQGWLDYHYLEEGRQFAPARAHVPTGIQCERVTFVVGDAHQLDAQLGPFDVALLANLIDRLRHPRQCLLQMPGLLRPGGQLIITSPYTWLSEHTPPAEWLTAEASASPSTLAALRDLLAPWFDLADRRDLPFLIREHRRKFQWSVAEATRWVRTSAPR